MDNDYVDTILRQWQRERPDLDASPMGVIGRISRAARALGRALDATFASFGLNGGEFDVLATLRRSGPPYRLTPTELFRDLMLSSGAMTNRLDQLERANLVARTPDPSDRRGTLVALTTQGQELVDAAVAAHLANEHHLLDALSSDERAQLAQLLRKLLRSLEDRPSIGNSGDNS
ncbi:MAG: MarR family transcriptional regulator [Roseiflexaceae bacterium]|nr:MarR family transcriptional regulator [Roseiflexaceae bacterium]